jgi:hypothetical protein
LERDVFARRTAAVPPYFKKYSSLHLPNTKGRSFI